MNKYSCKYLERLNDFTTDPSNLLYTTFIAYISLFLNKFGKLLN